VATWVAVRRRDRPALELLAVVGGASVVGIFAMSRIFGEFYDYVIRWMWIIAALAVVASAWALLRAWNDRDRGLDRTNQVQRSARVGVIGIVSVLAISVVAGIQMLGAELPAARNSRIVGGAVDIAAEAPELDPDGRYLVRWHDPASLGGVGFGALLELERRGFTVGVEAWASAGALPHRVIPEETATGVLWVVTGEPAIRDFEARDDAVKLAEFDERSPEEQAESAELRDRIEERLTEIGRADLIPTLDSQYGLTAFVIGDAPVPQDVKELAADYVTLRLPAGIFLVPPGAPFYP
jgi:hypothetical protein